MKWVKGVLQRLVRRLGSCPESRDCLYQGMVVGEGTYYHRQNLDGVAPRLISIGRDCVLAPTAMILTHDASTFIHTGKYRVAPVCIGDRCFLGYNSVVMPGVTLGDDVIVGAGAVVTSDVPAGTVVAGVPARALARTTEYMTRRRDELVDSPFPFGVVPTVGQLLELQRRAMVKCGVAAEGAGAGARRLDAHC